MTNLRDRLALWLLRRSDHFDAEWYLRAYPDVKAAGFDPYEHYLWKGAFENRESCGHPVPRTAIPGVNPALRRSYGWLANLFITQSRPGRPSARPRLTVIPDPVRWHGATLKPCAIGATALDLPQKGLRVSVIIPCYNSARYIAERLQSVLCQRWPIAELIILDDASLDGTRGVLNTLQNTWRREFPVLRSEINSGSPFVQWKKGLQHCTGDLVWVAEADDVAHPDFLGTLVPVFNDDRVGLAYAGSMSVDPAGRILQEDTRRWLHGDRTLWDRSFQQNGFEHVVQHLSVQNCIPNASAVLFRRDTLIAAFGRCQSQLDGLRMAGDWLVYAECLRTSDVYFNTRALNACRRHSTSQSFNFDKRKQLLEVALVQAHVIQSFHCPERSRDAAVFLEALATHLELPRPRDIARDWPTFADVWRKIGMRNDDDAA